MKAILLLTALLTLALPAWAASAVSPGYPLIEGLGSHRRAVTTSSAEAQRYFDQGFNFLFGFNHAAAIKSFQAALEFDANCAMAAWGIALASGPNINAPAVPADAAERACKAIAAARACADRCTAVEREMIEALAKRYAFPQPESRTALDQAYADAMRSLWHSHPNDADIGAMFAEARLDLRPWDQWTADGKPQPGTDEIIATLDAVLRIDLVHPLANHLYIHALEGSPQPERARAAADRLRHLQPALAHNMHMPSHIDVRLGLWHEAVLANQRAIAADQRLRAIESPAQGATPGYGAHNHHMLAYAAMMTGQRQLALEHARAAAAAMEGQVRKRPNLEAVCAMPYEVMTRFGVWNEILAAPDHPDWMVYTRAMRHAARGIAFAAKGETGSARVEQSAFAEGAKQVPETQMAAGNNSCHAVLAVVGPMLDGEILVREGNLEAGLMQLRQAVAAEDALRYDEPPNWLLPVRHSLGATLMSRGRFAEAEQIYREDLARLPGNGWSLYGLTRSLSLQKKNPGEAAAIEQQFKAMWAKADFQISSSCLCQPGA